MVFKELILTTTPGLEEFLVQELAAFGMEAKPYAFGAVACANRSAEDILFLNYASRLTHAVYIGLGSTRIESDDVQVLAEQIVGGAEFPFWDADILYCVRAYRRGTHAFTSVELERAVAGAVNRRRKTITGGTWRANLKDPTFLFDVFVHENNVWFGFNTTGSDLRNRIQLPFVHYAPLDRVLGAALLRAGQLKDDDTLLDPMCGGGNVLLEAIDLMRGDAPQRRRADFAFLRHPYFRDEDWEAAEKRYERKTMRLQLMAADRFGGKIAGLQENLRAYDAIELVKTHVGSAAHMDYLDVGAVDKIVVNPPYGVRISSTKEVSSLYTGFAQGCAAKKVRQVVAITPRHKTWEEAFHAAGYERSLYLPVVYGDMPAFVTKHTLV